MGTDFIGRLSAAKAGGSLKVRTQAAPDEVLRRIYQKAPVAGGSSAVTASLNPSAMTISEEPEGSGSLTTPSVEEQARAQEEKDGEWSEPQDPGEDADDGVWQSTDLAALLAAGP